MSSFELKWEERILGERYQIETLLGRGGMSSVYRAHDANLQRKVAIKMIHPHLTHNPEFVKRFEQEAASVAQLRHNHIVQVYDFRHEAGTYFMVMEFVSGESLAQKLRDLNEASMRLPLHRTLKILNKMAEAAHYAHQEQMIHRDIKPANMMIRDDGEPMLMDFGIAKLVGGQSHTGAGTAMGTAAYMSPEQVRGERSDYRSDIYALGITMFEMVRGETPYEGDSTFQVMLKHVNEPIPNIRSLDASFPQDVADILSRALEKDPNQRFQSAGDMAMALQFVDLKLFGQGSGPTPTVNPLQTMWAEANQLFEERHFVACLERLDAIRQLNVTFQQPTLDQLRQKAFDLLHERAVRLFREEQFEAAQTAVQQYRTHAPHDIEAQQLEEKVKHAIANRSMLSALQLRYDDATLLLEARRYEEALAIWQEIVTQKGSLPFVDRLDIAKRAREGLCTHLYHQALRAIADGDAQQAKSLMAEIHVINPHFPDSQNIASDILKREQTKQRKKNAARIFLILGVGLLLWAIFAVQQRRTAVPPILTTQTSTPTMQTTPLATLENDSPPLLEATTAVPSPIHPIPPTQTDTPMPTVTLTATETAVPTNTATPTEDGLKTAVVLLPSSIFAAPSIEATERGIVRPDDVVRVIGRSENGNWLYILNDDEIGGFVYGERLSWPGDVLSLPIFRSEEP